MKLSEIGKILGKGGDVKVDCEIENLLTDSRSLTKAENTLFFALSTGSADGHSYVLRLYEAGVRSFVVERVPDNMPDANFIVVPDTLRALQQVGSYCRSLFSGPLVGITGSRGKTTVKEWLFQLLESKYRVARSQRSYNSQIGVPLSLWQLGPDTELALIEAGISRPGEMEHLQQMIRPQIVVITNIGPEHDEGFSSRREKALEKAVLASEAEIVVYNADDELTAQALLPFREGKLMLGWSRSNPDAPVYISEIKHNTEGQTELCYTFRNSEENLAIPFDSEEDIENALNCLGVMLALGIEPGYIAYKASSLHRIGTRLNVSDGVNGCSLIFDSYTSDYRSLLSALDFQRRRSTPERNMTLILSDLHHEDIEDERLFQRISSVISQSGVSRLIGIGPAMCRHASVFPEGSRMFPSTEDMMRQMSTSDFQNELVLLKGAPEFCFHHILENLEARKHETVLEVNLDAVVKNFNYFRSHLKPETGLVAMVKAGGYGAGSYEIARTLQAQGAAYLAVAVLDEGIELRRSGITMPIMVMNPKVVNYRSMFAHRLEPEIYSMDMLQDVIREARKNDIHSYPVHIKLDTGMHRMGFEEEELQAVMDLLASQDNVTASSVFSHLATADCMDMDDYTGYQLDVFKRATEYMQSRYPTHIKRHVLNSAGILRFPEHQYDMCRLGIGLYGVNTLPPEVEKPLAVVSTLRTVIIAIKERKPGDTIGYGRRGKIVRPSRIATIPIGYADGMNRHFGCGNVSVLVNGKPAPTIGNICMDACMIDVTDIPCKVGDNVEIFGNNTPVQRLADLLDTIPYEILTSVSPRVKRVYYRE